MRRAICFPAASTRSSRRAPGRRSTASCSEREGGVLFTPDLFVHAPGGPFGFVPAEYMHDMAQARRTAEALLDRDFAVLCTGHGVPVTADPKAAIRDALAA